MIRIAILAAALFGIGMSASAATIPAVTKATDGIFNAFQSHPIVGIGEWHGLAQELDFYSALMRDPRFASEVGNVVLEIGDAAEQETADRYVNGESVPYAELRKVWADTVGMNPTMPFIGSMNVFDTIRSVNMNLPAAGRIKVWLGDPPIDWSKIKTKEDLAPLDAQRDSYPAALIEREILAKGKKALVIYGAAHFGTWPPGANNLRVLLEKSHPGALFIVTPYGGSYSKTCADKFERHVIDWPVPALVTPMRGSSWEEDLFPSGCGVIPRPPQVPEAVYVGDQRDNAGVNSDGLLYLGPRDRLLWSLWNPDIYLDLDFRAELERRRIIRSGKPFDDFTAKQNTAVPEPYYSN